MEVTQVSAMTAEDGLRYFTRASLIGVRSRHKARCRWIVVVWCGQPRAGLLATSGRRGGPARAGAVSQKPAMS
jgi:hypothetical protein